MSARIDKWLWAARFFKTRGLAQTALENGRVLRNGERTKSAHPVHVGDRLVVTAGERIFEVEVLGLSEVRGPAVVAQTLYRESAQSIARRAVAAEQRRFTREPAAASGRPSKRERRDLGRIRGSFD